MSDRIAKLKSMLEANPADAFCLYGLAMEHARLGEYARAIEWFDKSLAADPDSCYTYFHKAKTQEELGDVAAARLTLMTGLERARATRDAKAVNEIAAYLDEIS